MPGEPIPGFIAIPHALFEMERRGISLAEIQKVLAAPDERFRVREGRDVLQSIAVDASGRRYLIRVFVDIDRQPPEVVTAYRTSRIARYSRLQS